METPTEHPAYRAAKMIRELHEENLKLIADGQLFMRDGVDVTEEMAVACREQIVQCDAIMERAKHMDPKLWEPAALILDTVENVMAEAAEEGRVLASIPEIGNYDHEKNS